ncbi:MAG: biotin synthase BioB [Porphyromonas sp.]|nr:biotin synthase BioB [Porphyromonas sp.]
MNIAERIIGGERLTSPDEILRIVEETHREELYEACHRITRTLCGSAFDTCSIINVKSGRCSEDCHWCTQSGHYRTESDSYPILPDDEVLALAKHNDSVGIKRYSLVASGKRPTESEVKRYIMMYRAIGQATKLEMCASLGLATKEALQQLKEAGCTTYHCNMESAPSHFHKLCSTHTQAEKEQTLKYAQEVGMRRCSGGIIGMGETRRQRVEFALYLASMGIESIPINILHPMPGTPLQNQELLSPDEVLLAFCIFRLANPTAFLRFSGGRALLSAEVQQKGLYIGINAAITGGLLTTTASIAERDMELFTSAGYDVNTPTTWDE